MDNVTFENNSIRVNRAIDNAILNFLEEASGELEAQVKRNTAVDTGQLKSSWTHAVDKEKSEAVVGSPLENAIWEELGTGEFALNNDGRKTPWVYQDSKGNYHYTKGKRPRRPLFNAYNTSKAKIIKRAETLFGAEMK